MFGRLTHMDQDTFTKLARSVQHWHTNASDAAAIIIIPVLGLGVVGGFLLARWIFRGGLSRRSFISTPASQRASAMTCFRP